MYVCMYVFIEIESPLGNLFEKGWISKYLGAVHFLSRTRSFATIYLDIFQWSRNQVLGGIFRVHMKNSQVQDFSLVVFAFTGLIHARMYVYIFTVCTCIEMVEAGLGCAYI